MNLKFAFFFAYLCFFLGSTSVAQAATRSYQVDMIVFKNRPPSGIVSETSLPSQSYLKTALTRLKASNEYEVLSSESFVSELKTGVKQIVPIRSGSISFVLGYYLDIEVHLAIPPTYIDEKLKANSRKLLYIDNPNYGVLLYLSPVESKHVA